jgi:hypothetical protein
MSQSVRQSNLFTSEDWQTIYKSFKDVDFRAYDFDSLRASLIDYIRAHYPEDFNDYIESSEFIAVIELLAYLGTTLSFRVDLNSRENFLDTAERRESIVRLARMLSYTPKRNLAASGLLKLVGVQTNQQLTDSLGRNLNNTTIFWNDANNPDSFEQLTTILNAAFRPTNPFGRPAKSGTVGGIATDIYTTNSVPNISVSYNFNVPIRGTQYPFDVVNPDFDDNLYFYERHPNPANQFNLIYRNDGSGLGSANTGFFLLFKQGALQKIDERYDFPLRNRTTDVDLNNINETDVYVQEIDQLGTVINEWTKVPSLVGTNVIYNSISNRVRNIFTVIPRLNDQVTLKFGDGNFSDTPVGIFRTWVRTSANVNLTIRPEDIQNYEISIPYYGVDGQQYVLRLLFSLQVTIANGAISETNEQIRERAPQVFYTQNRMVNGEDYNIFPLTRGNEIAKIKALNRSHAGHSRYIDINDPTGTFQDVLVIGDDAAIYIDEESGRLSVDANTDTATIVDVRLESLLDTQDTVNFFYSEYYNAYLAVDAAAFDISNNAEFTGGVVYWEPNPKKAANDSGFFKAGTSQPIIAVDLSSSYLIPGSKIRFVDNLSTPEYSEWVTVTSIINAGNPVNPNSTNEVGPVELSEQVRKELIARDLIPSFRTTFTDTESMEIQTRVSLRADFGIGYDINANNKTGGWYIVPGTPTGNETFDISISSTASWIILAQYSAVDETWEFTTRGQKFIFESAEDVRFFFDPSIVAIDTQTGQPLRDEIEILATNTATSEIVSGPLGSSIKMQIDGLVTYEDGYKDPRKVSVKSPDSDEDGVPDDPLALSDFINDAKGLDAGPKEIFFERFVDFDNYEYFRLWPANQANVAGTYQLTQAGVDWLINEGITDFVASTASTAAPGIGYQMFEQLEVIGGTLVTSPAVLVVSTLSTIASQSEIDFDGAGSNGTFNGGKAYSNGDIITLNDGSTITVDAISLNASTVSGQTQTAFDATPGNGTFVGGDGVGPNAYVPTDTITLTDGTIITVNAVDVNGDVTDFVISSESTSGYPAGGTLLQLSTTGSGTGFTLTTGANNENSFGDVEQFTIATATSFGAISTNGYNATQTTVTPAAGVGFSLTLGTANQGVFSATVSSGGRYTTTPTNPVATTSLSGTGVGASFSINYTSLVGGYNAANVDLLWTTLDNAAILAEITTGRTTEELESVIDAVSGTIIYNETYGRFYLMRETSPTTLEIVETNDYQVRYGRSFQLDTFQPTNPLYFRWKHYAPRSNRVDPSISNIIDMTVLTNSYYSSVLTWKGSNDATSPVPVPPTTEDLRIQFSELNEYKMLSDQIIFKPGKFKLLFGPGAIPELQARFKVVKLPNTTVTDNEVKSRVITAIDEYFAVNNWDFGESFFYTELSTYIHQRLANVIATVVIVPEKQDSVFGDLFQVKAETDELFLSTATVSNVSIVKNLTDTNLRTNK